MEGTSRGAGRAAPSCSSDCRTRWCGRGHSAAAWRIPQGFAMPSTAALKGDRNKHTGGTAGGSAGHGTGVLFVTVQRRIGLPGLVHGIGVIEVLLAPQKGFRLCSCRAARSSRF